MSEEENRRLATFRLKTDEDQCGYPLCCPGRQPRFAEPEFFPSCISEVPGLEEDVKKFFKKTRSIYRNTGIPMMPCALHHFCLPFSPICGFFFCRKVRRSSISRAIKKFNKDHRSQGIYLEWNNAYHVYMQRGEEGVSHNNPPGIDLFVNQLQNQVFREQQQQQQQQPQPQAGGAPLAVSIPPPASDIVQVATSTSPMENNPNNVYPNPYFNIPYITEQPPPAYSEVFDVHEEENCPDRKGKQGST